MVSAQVEGEGVCRGGDTEKSTQHTCVYHRHNHAHMYR